MPTKKPKGPAKRKAKAPAKRGRPTLFTEDLGARICAGIADGKSLRKICATASMPSRETVRRWLNEDEKFRGQYARARDEQADYYADEIVEIADTEKDPQKARVRVDARKWVASKLKPKKYGDRVAVTDGEGKPLAAPVMNTFNLSNLTDEQLDQLEALARAARPGSDPEGEGSA